MTLDGVHAGQTSTVLEPLVPTANRAPAAGVAPERRAIMRFGSGTLHENWYVAALSKEVRARKPLAVTILEEPLVLFRNAHGGISALLDRCLHRNAALSKGDVFDGCIGCPYHGWTYNGEGELVSVPSEGPERFPRPGM